MMRMFLALALAAVPLAWASPAHAEASACQGTSYDQVGFELFTPELQYVPPPLRVAAWDCASRDADRPFGLDTGTAVEYSLVYTDVDFDVVVQIVRAFEQQGWLGGYSAITSIDTGDGMQDSVRFSADQLAALGSPPLFAGGRFGNEATRHDIISLSYADGVNYRNNGNAFTTPSLVVSVSLTESFAGDGLTDPSVLSGLKSIGDVIVTPTGAAITGTAAVMLTLVIGYPSTLLNTVIGPSYDRVLDWMRRRRERAKAAPGATTEPPVKPRPRLFGWLFLPGLMVAAVISGFVDPSFGFNALSARVLVTAFLSLLVFNVAAWTLVRMIVHLRHPEEVAVIRFRWGSLALVALTVLVARLLDFYPGVIFGLVAGLVFSATLAKSRSALVVVLGSGFGLAVSLVSWVGFSVLAPLAAGAPGNLLLVTAAEFFSAVTIEGIASLPLALLPLVALDGHKLFAHRRWLWAVCYAVGLLAFMLVLLTIPDAWGEIPGDFVRWVVLFAVFAVFAVAVWVVHVVLERRRAETKGLRVPG